MVIDIKMCRFENVPWGFTLVGGADFEYPLTVVKVNEGSIAQEAGLKVGDVIVRINDTPTSPLTHEESHKVITRCGNVFFLGIKRENEEQHVQPNYFPTTNKTIPTTPTSFLEVTEQPKLPTSFVKPLEQPAVVEETLPSERPPSPIPPLGTEPCVESKDPVPHLYIDTCAETFTRARSPTPLTPTSFVAVVAVQTTVNMPSDRSPSPIPPLGTEPCLEAKSPGPYLTMDQSITESLTKARSPSPVSAIRTEPSWESTSLLPSLNPDQGRRSASPFTRQTLEYRPSTVFLQDPLEFRPSQSPIPFSPYLEPKEANESTEDTDHQDANNEGANNNEQYVVEHDDRPCSVLSEESERKLVEEEIAAVLSDASEIAANELNNKGINIYRLYPKPGVCMSSQVLRTLSEEASKTKLEKEKENRRWTTFLQKPNRPIPKSKQQLEAERRAANAYKVKIVKSSPRPSRSVTPVPEPKPEPVKEPTPPPQVTEEPQPEPESEPEVEAPTPVDTEVPNLEETNANKDNPATEEYPSNDQQEEIEKTDKEKETTPEAKEMECPQEDEKTAHDLTEQTVDVEANNPLDVEKTEEELALERQLADVQRQLAALSNLPSTIQSTLDTVTRQLADLLPSFKLQQEKQISPEAREISLERNDEQSTNEQQQPQENADDENADIKVNDNGADKCHESGEKDDASTIKALSQQEEQDNKANEQIANDTNEARDTIDKNPINQKEVTSTFSYGSVLSEEIQQMDDEQKLKKQKSQLFKISKARKENRLE
ncbi:Z band alternatively spliced PDZ-motif protein 67 isoform X3 [Musca autumnalis]|uniref:Z band alternatively spliced PDZ-motif protein 67 isoform X3 n=1 Tax=Musca autumnalis TaxID=221902 RepID=UPI003CF6A64A